MSNLKQRVNVPPSHRRLLPPSHCSPQDSNGFISSLARKKTVSMAHTMQVHPELVSIIHQARDSNFPSKFRNRRYNGLDHTWTIHSVSGCPREQATRFSSFWVPPYLWLLPKVTRHSETEFPYTTKLQSLSPRSLLKGSHYLLSKQHLDLHSNLNPTNQIACF